ncbi:MAG: hypothetical protein IPH57_08525 [Saprospiraceae bacterium]|nr:hypothetical protein [Saprospiraceae bacterium]
MLLIGLPALIIYCKKIILLQTLASTIEVIGIFYVFISELFASNFIERWKNPMLDKPVIGKLSQAKEYFKIDGTKHYYYIKLGFVLNKFLIWVENYLNSSSKIKSAYFWLRNAPSENNCKLEFNFRAVEVDSIDDIKCKINDIKKYPLQKLFGYLMIFIGFLIQLIYNLMIF